MRRSPVPLLTAVALVAGCASGRPTGSGAAAGAPAPATSVAPQAKSDPAVLTQEEITAANLPDGYELVNRLRRPWLRRDATNGGEVSVYVDQQPYGAVEKLRDIPAVEIAEMRYYGHVDAMRRWGGDVPGGVILVTRRH